MGSYAQSVAKRIGETFRVGVDFAALLEDGESIVEASCSASATKAGAVVDTMLVADSIALEGTTLSVRLAEAQDAGTYRVDLEAVTDQGNEYIETVVVTVT